MVPPRWDMSAEGSQTSHRHLQIRLARGEAEGDKGDGRGGASGHLPA